MAGLARRLRARFPALLNQTYFQKRYPIISTQVSCRLACAFQTLLLACMQRWLRTLSRR